MNWKLLPDVISLNSGCSSTRPLSQRVKSSRWQPMNRFSSGRAASLANIAPACQAYALTWKNSSSAVLYTVVESSQTRELTIQQVDVGVQATDGTWAVIDKSISDPIVFYANRPLKNGDKVIVEESGESND